MSKLQANQIDIPNLAAADFSAGGGDIGKVWRWNGSEWAADYDQLPFTGPIVSATYGVLDIDRVVGMDNFGGGGSSLVNLPAAPVQGHVVRIYDYSNIAASRPITVDGNGYNIGQASQRVISADNGVLTVGFNGSGWVILEEYVGEPWSWRSIDLNAVAANYLLNNANTIVHADPSSGALSVRLPGSNYRDGQLVFVYNRTASEANAITVDGNGLTINGSASKVLSTARAGVLLAWNNTNGEWTIVSEVGAAAPAGGWTIFDLNDSPGSTLTTDDTIVHGDPSGGGMTVYLPNMSMRTGQLVIFYNRSTSTNSLTLDGNGFNINGASTKVLSSARAAVTVAFNDSNGEWTIVSEKAPATPTSPWTVVNLNTSGSGSTLTTDDTIVHADPTFGSMNVNLPGSPRDGQLVFFLNRSTSTNALTLNGNGNNINGSSSKVLTAPHQSVLVGYDSASTDWTILAEGSAPVAPTPVTLVSGFGTWNVAAAEKWLMIDTTFMSVTVNLPSSPSSGEEHTVMDVNNAGTNNITVSGNGHNINGSGSTTISTNRASRTFVYDSNTTEWRIVGGWL